MRSALLPVCLLLAVTACNEQKFTVVNRAPEATILSPEDGAEVFEGYALTITGVVNDLDGDTEDLTYSLTVDGAEICEGLVEFADGNIACDTTVPVGASTLEVSLTTRDALGGVGSDTVTYTVIATEAPTIALTAPEATGVYYSDQLVTFTAQVGDAEDDPEDLVVAWTSSLGDDLTAVNAAPDSSGVATGFDNLQEGQHALTATVTDTTGKTGTASVVVDVGPPNTPPSCAITAPSSGDAAEQGAQVIFEGTVGDIDVAADWLTVEWSSDKDGVLGTSTPSTSGDVAFSWSDLSVQTHTITLTVTDEVGATCTDFILYSVGTPPTVSLVSPVSGSTYSEGDTISFEALVSDNEDAPNALTLDWTLDGAAFSSQGADSAGTALFNRADIAPGVHDLGLTVTDADGLFASTVVSFTVNGLPTAPVVGITPDPADTTDSLTATLLTPSTDPDGSTVDYAYTWYRSGIATTVVSQQLPATETAKGEIWRVVVTPSDGTASGPAGEASITIRNAPPVLTGVTVTPSPANTEDTLTCTPGAVDDPDADSHTFAYAWTVNGVDAGVSGPQLSSTAFSRDQAVICTVTPHDGEDAGAPVASLPLVIDNSVPSVTGVAISPAQPTVGDTVTCSYATFADADGDADQSTIAWTIDGVPAGSGSTLAGAFTNSSVIACTVTPHDGTDMGTPVSATVSGGNNAPSIASVSVSPESPTVSDVLTCTYAGFSDPDGDADQSTLAWWVDGVQVGSGATLSEGFAKGDVVECRATPSDGISTGTPVSGTAAVVNSAPTAPTVALSPASPATQDALSAEVTVAATDADADPLTYRYTWSRNGVVDATHTGDTVPSSATAAGDTWSVSVRAWDGETEGLAGADSVSVANTAPYLVDVTLDPDPVYTDGTLTCTPGLSGDDDGDAVTFSYAWTVDGQPQVTTGETLDGSAFDRDDPVVCTVTPSDGSLAGDPVSSNVVVVSNTPPVLSGVTLTPNPARTLDTLTCVPGTATDADQDAVTFDYTWTVDDVPAGANRDTLAATAFVRGQEVVCTATPTDGTSPGASQSATRRIDNTAPAIATVQITPEAPQVGDVVTCAYTGFTDDDGDADQSSIAWQVDGAAAGTGDTLGSAFTASSSITCTVTPFDGTDEGTPVATTTGGTNTLPTITATVTPTTARVGETLTCEGTADDADGDTPTVTYAWSTGATGASYVVDVDDDPDTVITCTATAEDDAGATASADASATVLNTDPVVTASVTPSTGQVGDTLTCSATATDADGGSPTVTYAWSTGATGSTYTLQASDDPGTTITCTATATDADEGTDTDTASATVVNTDPVVTASVTPSTGQVGDTLTCSATATDADGGSPNVNYVWSTGARGPSYYIPASDDPGTTITCYATATDDDGGTDTDTASATVVNTDPVVTASVTPSTGQVGDTLTCSATATDADGGSPGVTYAWSTGAAGPAYVIQSTDDPGTTITCTATATDDDGGTDTADASATVLNTAPVLGAVTITPDPANNDDTLTCSASATDADGGTPDLAYAWDNTAQGISYPQITATLDLAAVAADAGDSIRCTVTATDDDSGTDQGSATVALDNRAPTVTATLIASGAGNRDSTLTCTGAADDDDGDVTTLSFAWDVAGAPVAASTTDATSSTLTGAFDAGQTVTCTVTAEDTSGLTGTDDALVVITNQPPVVAAVTLSPDPVRTNDTLTASASASDPDGDSLTLTYAWYVDNVLVQDGASSTLDGSAPVGGFDKGQQVYVTVTADDGQGGTDDRTSPALTVLNTPPGAPTVRISPSDPSERVDLICHVDVSATDVDHDLLTYSYTWLVDGSDSGISSSTVSASETNDDETWTCEVTAFDGLESGPSATAAVDVLALFRLADNGVTVLCPDAAVGESGVVNGITYTKRDRDFLLNTAVGDDFVTACTSGITDMTQMFVLDTTFNEDISSWDTSSVTTMNAMFYFARAFDQDIRAWDVSSVQDMYYMFHSATVFNQDISLWDVSSVTDMTRMFYNADAFNQDIGLWDVSSVTQMSGMFYSTDIFNQDIGGWDVSSAVNMDNMFRYTEAFNQDLSGWCVPSIPTEPTNFSDSAASWTLPQPNWNDTECDGFYLAENGITILCPTAAVGDSGVVDGITYTKRDRDFLLNTAVGDEFVTACTSDITDMSQMFEPYSFNEDISGWDVSSVTDMSRMFYAQNSFNQDISGWDVSSVTDMSEMFSYALVFNQDIGDWDVSSVTDMSFMFGNADVFNQDIGRWDTSRVIDMSFMFSNAETFNQDIGAWDVGNVNNMEYMFRQAYAFNHDIGDWDVSSVTDMTAMFQYTESFNQDIGNWDVRNVMYMSFMFYEATAFNQDLSGWCVIDIISNTNFSLRATAWTLPQPVWGTCP